jgi:hypothetical protein
LHASNLRRQHHPHQPYRRRRQSKFSSSPTRRPPSHGSRIENRQPHRRKPGRRRRHLADGHRKHSRRCPGSSHQSQRPRHPLRDVRRRRGRPRREGLRHKQSQDDAQGTHRRFVPDRHPEAVRFRRQQPLHRDARHRLRQQHE